MKILKKLTAVLLCLTVLFGAFSITTASAAEIATDDEVGARKTCEIDYSELNLKDTQIGSMINTYSVEFSDGTFGIGVCLEQYKKTPTNDTSQTVSFAECTNLNVRKLAYYYYSATAMKAFTYNGKSGYTFSGLISAICKTRGVTVGTNTALLIYRYTMCYLYSNEINPTSKDQWDTLFNPPKGQIGITTAGANCVSDLVVALKAAAKPPSYFKCYLLTPKDTATYQTLMVVPMTKLNLRKSADDPNYLAYNNNCYSLEGAKYEVYTDEACTQPLLKSDGKTTATITTDEDGKGSLSGVVTGYTEFWCKEVTAPTGYKLNSTPVKFTDSGKTDSSGYPVLTAEVEDPPVSDPISGSIITKQDSDGNSLAGAQFTVKYYDGYYTSSNVSSKTAKCTWVFKTGSDGKIYFDSAHKVSGPSLYYNENGKEAYPLGTITVQEAKAPTGYAINSTLYVCQITQSGNNTVQSWSPSTAVVSNDNLTVTDNKYIKLQLLKVSSNPDVTDGNSNYSLAGAVYNIYTNSSCTGTAIGSITTDSNGYGRYGSSSATNNSSDDKGTAYYARNAGSSIELKAGVTYYCKEVTAPTGYKKSSTVYTFVSTGIKASDGATIYRTSATSEAIKEPVTYGDVKLTKKDSSTKDILTGSQWQLYTSDGTLVHMVMKGVTGSYQYSTSGSYTVIETNSSGVLTVDKLPYGSYYFKEYKAPDGYQISTAKYTFTVTATTSSVEKIAYNSTTSGNVELVKENGNGSVLYGSQWQLYTKSGVPVLLDNTSTGTYQYKKTDSSGEATTMTAAGPITQAGADPSFLLVKNLPVGSYYFIETKAPSRYMPYGKKLEFSVTASGTQTLNVNLEVIDTPTMLAETGAGGAVPFYATGAGFAALAAVFIIYHFKSKKRKENAK